MRSCEKVCCNAHSYSYSWQSVIIIPMDFYLQMSDDEVMRFEITDHDLENEFNTGLRRPRISKNQATYGVWAEDSDEEAAADPDARPSFSGGLPEGSSRRRGAHGFISAGPVGFVSAGIQIGSKGRSGEDDDDNEDDDNDQGGSGTRPARSGKESTDDDDDDDDDGDPFRAGKFRRTKQAGSRMEMQGQIAGMRTSGWQPTPSLGRGFGDWEKHTKGIGAKLLMKMGYQSGKGLGKDLQGRSTIVEAHLRKGRGAIGAYGREKSAPDMGAGAKGQKDSEDEEEVEFKAKLQQWKRPSHGSQSKQTKVRYVYKTVDQVLEEGKWRKVSQNSSGASAGAPLSAASAAPSKVKVIDMTGREKRVLSGYHAIAAQQMPDDDDAGDGEDFVALQQQRTNAHFDLPELKHNIDLILDQCENELISADRRLKYNRDRIEVLSAEEEKLSSLVERERLQIDTIESVLQAVEGLEEDHRNGSLDLESAKEAFAKMRNKFPDEYK